MTQLPWNVTMSLLSYLIYRSDRKQTTIIIGLKVETTPEVIGSQKNVKKGI